MGVWHRFLLIPALAGLIGSAQAAVTMQPAISPEGRLSGELNGVVLDLMTGFSNALASRERRYAIESQRFARVAASYRAEQRRLAAGNRSARSRIAELERRLESLSWVTESRFRDIMIAYRTLITRALQAASPRALEGWRLLAAGHPAAGLEILRENERLEEQADRDAATQVHAAVDQVTREAAADRLRLIAIEALKSAISRQLPADVAIADWLNVVRTGESNRGDHLILSYIYYLDGNEAESANQRAVSATRPNPPERISTLLDELFGAPAAIVFQILAIGPDVPDRLAALQAPLDQITAQRVDISPLARRELIGLYSGFRDCVSSIDQSAADGASPLSDGGDRCLILLSRATTLSSRLTGHHPGRRPRSGGWWQGATGVAVPDSAEVSAIYADIMALALVATWSDDTPVADGANARAGEAARPAAASPRWRDLADALQRMAATCARRVTADGPFMPQICARITLHLYLARRAAGQEPAPGALAADVTKLIDAIGRRTSGRAPTEPSLNDVQALLAWLDRMVAELVSRIDAHQGVRIANALIEESLTARRHEYPNALDDVILMDGIAWYEEFTRSREDRDVPQARRTPALYQTLVQTLSHHPAFAPSCYALLQFGDAILASQAPLDASDVRMLQGLLPPARSCGLAPIPALLSIPPGDPHPGPVHFRDMLRLSYMVEMPDRLRRNDLATASALANIVAYDTSTPTAGAVFLDGDYASFSAYTLLANYFETHDLLPEAISAESALFSSGEILASADPAYLPCDECPGARWRFDVGTPGAVLGELLLETGDENGALEAYRRVIALGPRAGQGLGFAHEGRGLILMRRGDAERGLHDLRTAFELSSRDRLADASVDQTEVRVRRNTIMRNFGFGAHERRLHYLARALEAAGHTSEAEPLYRELFANLYETMDAGVSHQGVALLLLEADTDYCASRGRAGGREAGRRCLIEQGYQLARRRERPGVPMALRSVVSSLREDLTSRRAQQQVCAAGANMPDVGARDRLFTELGLACR